MKRRCVEEPAQLAWDDLPTDVHSLIYAACAPRERWLCINRAWTAAARHTLWLAYRSECWAEPSEKVDLLVLGTLLHSSNLKGIRDTAKSLWGALAGPADHAPPELCRGLRVLDGINVLATDLIDALGVMVFPPRCGEAYLLFMEPGGSYALLDCDAYKSLLSHNQGHRITRTASVHDLRVKKPKCGVRYAQPWQVQLPTAGAVAYHAKYPWPVQLDTTWWIFLNAALAPAKLAQFLSRKHAVDEARGLCATLLLGALRPFYDAARCNEGACNT